MQDKQQQHLNEWWQAHSQEAELSVFLSNCEEQLLGKIRKPSITSNKHNRTGINTINKYKNEKCQRYLSMHITRIVSPNWQGTAGYE